MCPYQVPGTFQALYVHFPIRFSQNYCEVSFTAGERETQGAYELNDFLQIILMVNGEPVCEANVRGVCTTPKLLLKETIVSNHVFVRPVLLGTIRTHRFPLGVESSRPNCSEDSAHV